MNNEKDLAKFDRKNDANDSGLALNQMWAQGGDMQNFVSRSRSLTDEWLAHSFFGDVELVADSKKDEPAKAAGSEVSSKTAQVGVQAEKREPLTGGIDTTVKIDSKNSSSEGEPSKPLTGTASESAPRQPLNGAAHENLAPESDPNTSSLQHLQPSLAPGQYGGNGADMTGTGYDTSTMQPPAVPEIMIHGDGEVPAYSSNKTVIPSERIHVDSFPASSYHPGEHLNPVTIRPTQNERRYYDHLLDPRYEDGTLVGRPAHLNAPGARFVYPEDVYLQLTPDK